MPRDGSNIYTRPFPDVTAGTTIESAVYNGFTSDVAIDLNAPRPVVAGGTGATTPVEAISNLGGEVSKIQVTNYDSHAFLAGSFYSASTATAPPVAGHAFAGFCYPTVVGGVATTDMFIEARDLDDGAVPPIIYVRQKKAGVWGSWAFPTFGGSNPSFGGSIFLNNRQLLSNDPNLDETHIRDSDDAPSRVLIKVNNTNTRFYASKFTFTPFNVGLDYAVIEPTQTTFIDNVIAQRFTATTAISASEDSTKVSTTSWVRTHVASQIASSATVTFPQNTRSANYTLVLSDAGKHIYHPSTDSTPRTFTIPANATVAYPVQTVLMFVNFGGTVSIAITADSMSLAGTASTGTRTLTGVSQATCLKVTPTSWIIWGNGLT